MFATRVVPPEMKDLSRIVEIEESCYSSPWTAGKFVRALRTGSYICMLLEIIEETTVDGSEILSSLCGCSSGESSFKVEIRQDIVGFLIYRLEKNVMDIWNLAIDPKYRRKGHGTDLIDYLKGRLIRGRRRKIQAVVNEYDLPGQLFLQSAGFRCEEIVHRFRNLKADCYSMQYYKPFVPRSRLQFGDFADAET